MCPRSIMLEKDLKPALEGKTIACADWQRYYTGKYSWHGDEVPELEELAGGKIIFAGASCILTDNGMLLIFAYMDGCVRYYEKGETIDLPVLKKSVTHGYHATIKLDDGATLGFNLYSWATFYKVFKIDTAEIDTRFACKSKRYPFIPKSPIEVTDPEDFTLERFREWLSDRPNVNIIENCATAKGAFRIDNPVMNYILRISKIHPLTKTRTLTEAEVFAIYDNTTKLVGEYRTGVRISEHIDIYGRQVVAHNDVLWMNTSVLSAPCPVCGAPIAAVPAAGTKMYYCPVCQVRKTQGRPHVAAPKLMSAPIL